MTNCKIHQPVILFYMMIGLERKLITTPVLVEIVTTSIFISIPATVTLQKSNKKHLHIVVSILQVSQKKLLI